MTFWEFLDRHSVLAWVGGATASVVVVVLAVIADNIFGNRYRVLLARVAAGQAREDEKEGS